MRNPFQYLFGRRKQAETFEDLVSEGTEPLRDRIMAAYNMRGLAGYTADEVAEQLGAGVLMVRPRVTELFQLGKLRKTQVKRANRSGIKAVVLVSTRVPSASGIPIVPRKQG